MDFLAFLVLSMINLGLILFIIRKWSFFSAEGLSLSTLGLMILTDNVQLPLHYLYSPGDLPLGYKEFSFRVYPTFVHIVGLGILIAALWLSNPSPKPVIRELNKMEILRLRNIGIAIAICGFILIGIAIRLVSGFSTTDFYVALNAFRTDPLPFGGFWYRGADIAVFGLALTLPNLQRKRVSFFLVLGLMMFVSFFLRTNKGGLEEPIVWGAYVLYVYNRLFYKSLLKLPTVALACAIMFAGMGLKSWFLPWALHHASEPPKSVQNLLQVASGVVGTRWGDNSNYRGYCQFIYSLSDYGYLFQGHRVGFYTLTSWVPRLLAPDKPDHPFRGLGFMIYSDFHTYPMETPAPMLMGSAFADDGFTSLAAYLFLSGLFLSLLRRFATAPHRALDWHVGYVVFVLFGGLSAEAGTISIVYTLLLAYGAVAAAWLIRVANSLPVYAFRSRVPQESPLVQDNRRS